MSDNSCCTEASKFDFSDVGEFERLVQMMEIPEPKLVINLLPSWSGTGVTNVVFNTKFTHGRFAEPGKHELLEADRKLREFLRKCASRVVNTAGRASKHEGNPQQPKEIHVVL